jgi:hypothetical protein
VSSSALKRISAQTVPAGVSARPLDVLTPAEPEVLQRAATPPVGSHPFEEPHPGTRLPVRGGTEVRLDIDRLDISRLIG